MAYSPARHRLRHDPDRVTAMLLPFVAWPDITFSPPPTPKVAAVYRYLGIKTSRHPLVEVQVVEEIPPPDGITAATGLHIFVPSYVWQDKKTHEALVVLDRRASKKFIARALVEALD